MNDNSCDTNSTQIPHYRRQLVYPSVMDSQQKNELDILEIETISLVFVSTFLGMALGRIIQSAPG